MKMHLFLYAMTLTGILVLTSTGAAKDRLWMARSAAQIQANHQMDDGKAFRFSSADQLAGERLWFARENALRQLEKSNAGSDMAGSRGIKSPESTPDKTQKKLVCEKSPPGFRPFFKSGGNVSTDREKCG
ncbi:MAG: hypothetical protein P8X96_20005 [Desulfobacteraceae bacterium]|jgi:hypothetical protein